VFLESLQLLSSVGRLSYDMTFKSVKTCSSWALWQHALHRKWYSKITSRKSPLFCMTTFSASSTNVMAFLPQSRYYTCYVSRRILATPPQDCRNPPMYAQTNSCTLLTHDISLGSLTLPAPETGDFVELILLYLPSTVNNVVIQNVTKNENP
jgi:hypothetical protein